MLTAFALGSIASLPVDNAARHVAGEVCARLPYNCLVNRDPSHCSDLLSKDLYETDVVASVVQEADEVVNFVKKDRINAMRIEMSNVRSLDITCAVNSKVDTRMNLVDEYLESAAKQASFLAALPFDDRFKKYYNERKSDEKARIDALLGRCNHERFTRMHVLRSITTPLKQLQEQCSRVDSPLSAFILNVQALRNEINVALNAESGKFNRILGDHAAREVADMIRVRFNMDGRAPSGRKVGLIDPHHLWCYLVDPHAHEWHSKFIIPGSVAQHVNDMISFYIPLDDDGSPTTRDRVKAEFMV